MKIGVNDKYLTCERLREIVHYDPNTGAFTWCVGGFGRSKGRQAGSRKNCKYASSNGADYRYGKISIDRHIHRLSRVAWLYMTGKWPSEQLDHKDGDGWNNAWINLRPASATQNSFNKAAFTKSKSGLKGISKDRYGWRGEVVSRGIRHRKNFKRIEDAIAWRDQTAKAVHGEFAVMASGRSS